MGRQRVDISPNHYIICGYDRPMHTFYAQLYRLGDDPNDAPIKAFGYHPYERNPGERTEHGPYPVNDLNQVDLLLIGWQLKGDQRELVGAALARDTS
jgi:hypothetical protein